MILNQIKNPQDLKGLQVEQLESLAVQLREKMLKVVSKNGGHLASSLGVVELTLALHAVYDSPMDKIIWDVGHQSYAHKLLTGRFEDFKTLRQYGGISGFPKRSESIYDHFNTGHSSTSIAAAVGMALARDQLKKKDSVIAVIGDGALTGGMAFEALNYAGDLQLGFTVILNDNEMSIADNVGALSSYLNRIRTDPMYEKGKDEIESIIKRLPRIGTTVIKLADRLKDAVKYLVVPGMFFEELGYTYLGPIDGHSIASLQSVLRSSKKIKGPKLIHVVTKKGKGYSPAEKNPNKFHGTGPFDCSTGVSEKKQTAPTYTEVFGKTLVDAAKKDSRIIAITAAMPDGTGLQHFQEIFPERYFDVGIAEQTAVTIAAGMASQGFVPVVAIYSTFLQRAYDQIIHDVCMQKLPVVFAIDRAGLVGEDGETHHGVFDISFLRAIPDLVIMAPKDEAELQSMLITAINLGQPVAIRYPRGAGIGVMLQQEIKSIEFNQGETIRKGKDLTIVAVGPHVYTALEAVPKLERMGIQSTIINPRFLKPIDKQLLLGSIQRTKKVITIEENITAGGFGSAILELISDYDIRASVKRLGIGDNYVTHGKPGLLREQEGLCVENLLKSAVAMTNGLKAANQ